jgi:TPR repeat protein
MKNFCSGIFLLWILACFPAIADLYNDAYTAYKNEDYATAVSIWSSEELKTDPRALFSLGRLRMQGVGLEKDEALAVAYYLEAAEAGHLSAQFNLGLAYFKGRGVEKDTDKAMKWWAKAADAGHSSAQYNIGALLWEGRVVEQDQATAMKWFRTAMHNNNEQASTFLQSLFEPMYSELRENFKFYRDDTTVRDISLIEELGLFKLGQQAYSQGAYDQALKYWTPLAEDGHFDSQYFIAQLYEKGEGVKASFETALSMYEKAARAGQPDSQYRLGFYHINEAPETNRTLGLYWMQSAADNGHLEAQNYMKNEI